MMFIMWCRFVGVLVGEMLVEVGVVMEVLILRLVLLLGVVLLLLV